MARERKKQDPVKVDMTPMIDVVFQLIIFFILTMTVTNQNLKDVVLPTALTATEEPKDEEDVYMIHIYNNLATRGDEIPPAEGWHVTTPDTDAQLKTVVDVASELAAKVAAHGKRDEMGMSKLTLLVRGDMRAPSHFFAVILEACQKDNVKIYKIQVSIAPPPEMLTQW